MNSRWSVRIQRQDGSEPVNFYAEFGAKRPRIDEFMEVLRESLESLEDTFPDRAQFSRQEAAERRAAWRARTGLRYDRGVHRTL